MPDWGAGAQGAAGGAATGAMVGSVAGPWGAAIGGVAGGVIGGLGGMFGGKKKPDAKKARFEDREAILGNLQGQYERSLGAQAPTLGRTMLGNGAQLAQQQQAQWRDQQMAQAGRLGQIASGQMQGAGELAAERQAARQVANQQAMALMGRGGPGMARAAARNTADIGANAAGAAQVAALQDQQAANAQLGQLLGQGREQDLSLAGQNAQLAQQRMLQQGAMDQQGQLAQLQAELQQRGLNAQQQQSIMSQWLQMNQSELAARMGQEQVAMSQPSLMGPLLQAGGQIGAAYLANRGGGGGGGG